MEAAVTAARAIRPLDLLDALDVVTLLAETGDPRFGRWATRWIERTIAENDLLPEAVEKVRRLMHVLPTQSEARAVTVALRSYARPPRTWS
ncbi:hypothetical protein [Conexibacter sp. CPCC 206217]|uniref:hypothetical protein n=1 Tax=Conexibacter sp. CPCC 206217 TaxID=3064574 RepID=UPI00272419C4|nr:hypothetical protein [Conexibacter sp. CPCC 206217]MDO8208999.1 hypothetical protein [Conexibacter sp. CPCC 206217]